ncbi:hypothetical protein FLLO111716_09145 [Flavobacterium longum]|uniref:hypothetical protein n=1 Tax=Flavobacterium longum TaxID=1299340 RepID=UPI0039E975D6
MGKITDLTTLDAEIARLSQKQEANKNAVANEVNELIESLTPANVLRNAFKSIKETPGLKADLLQGGIGLATGFLTNKLLLGKVSGPLRAILATAVPALMTKAAIAVPDKVKDDGLSFFAKTLRAMKIKSSEDQHDDPTSGAVL